MPENIGFVGVGRMGANMARRLKECGWPITAVFDVNTGAAQTLAQELGSTAASDLKAVTALADVVFTVVTDDQAMKNIYRGGLLSRAKGKLFINCATVTPAIHVWVEQKCEAKGAQSLEACMASSLTQAREGSLYLMCGGKPEAFERAKADSGKIERVTPLPRPGGQSRRSEGAGQHGHELQHRRPGGRTGFGRRPRPGPDDVAGGVRPDGRQFVRVAD